MIPFSRDICIRPFRKEDAPAVCELWNRHGLMTNRYGYPLEPDDLLRGVGENCIVAFFVATLGPDRVIGTMDYSPVCWGYAAPEGGLHARSLFVEPQFRGGKVVAGLFMQGVQFCVNSGYRRVDQLSVGVNESAIRLYKKAGARQITDPAVGAEEIIELVNFSPYLMRYLYHAFRHALDLLLPSGSPFDYTRGFPSVVKGDANRDDFDFHGTRAVHYDLNLRKGLNFGCLIDLRTESIAAISGDLCEFELVPANGRTHDGPTRHLRFRFSNPTPDQTFSRVTVTGGSEPVIVRDAKVEPHGEWSEQVEVPVCAPTGLERATAELELETTMLGRPATLHFPVVTWTAGPPPAAGRSPAIVLRSGRVHARPTDAGWQLVNPGLRLDVDATSGAVSIIERTTSECLVHDAWPDVGPPFPPTHKQPVARELQLVGLHDQGDSVSLEMESPANVWWCRDPANIERLTPEGVALAPLRLRRRITLGADPLVRVDLTVVRTEDRQDAPSQPTRLRTYPWATGRALTLAVPLGDSIVRAPVVYQGYPFLLEGFDHLRSPDLPSDPSHFREPWSAFVGDGVVAGAIWPGADEVRFGLRWMPSVLYAVPPLAPGEEASLPTRYLWCGVGDHHAVAAACSAEASVDLGPSRCAASCEVAARSDVPVTMSPRATARPEPGRVEVAGQLCAYGRHHRQGRLELEGAPPLELQLPSGSPTGFELRRAEPTPMGVRTVELVWREGLGSCQWRVPVVVHAPSDGVAVDRRADGALLVDNGLVRVVCPDGRGPTVASMTTSGVELLGGDGLICHVIDPARRWFLTPGSEDAPWEFGAAPVSFGAWQGAELVSDTGEGPWSAVGMRILVLTKAGAPLVAFFVEYANSGGATRRFGSAVTSAFAPGGADGFRYCRDGSEHELLRGELLRDRLHPGRRVASGTAVGALVGDDSIFVQTAPTTAEVRGWCDDEGDWRLNASVPIELAPGEAKSTWTILALASPGVELSTLVSRDALIGGFDPTGRISDPGPETDPR